MTINKTVFFVLAVSALFAVTSSYAQETPLKAPEPILPETALQPPFTEEQQDQGLIAIADAVNQIITILGQVINAINNQIAPELNNLRTDVNTLTSTQNQIIDGINNQVAPAVNQNAADISQLRTDVDTIELTPGPEGPRGLQGFRGLQGQPGEIIDVMRFDSGINMDVDVLEVYFNHGENQGTPENGLRDFRRASSLVGIDGAVTEFQYNIGTTLSTGNTITATLYKNAQPTSFSCSVISSDVNENSCTSTGSLTVSAGDSLAVADVTTAGARFDVNSRHATVFIISPEPLPPPVGVDCSNLVIGADLRGCDFAGFNFRNAI